MAPDFDQTFRQTIALANSAMEYQRRLEIALTEILELKSVSREIIFQSREIIARTDQLLRHGR